MHERAKAAGAEITRELQDTDYGSREFSAQRSGGQRVVVRDVRPVCQLTGGPCYKSRTAMSDRPAHLTLHTAPRGFGYAYFSYRHLAI